MQLKDKKQPYHYLAKKSLSHFFKYCPEAQNVFCKYYSSEIEQNINSDLFQNALENCKNFYQIINFENFEKDIYNTNFFEGLYKKFDIIFMDPPYKDKNLNLLLDNINNQKILNKDGILVIHRHKDEKDLIPNNFKIVEEKKYGVSKIIFLNVLN